MSPDEQQEWLDDELRGSLLATNLAAQGASLTTLCPDTGAGGWHYCTPECPCEDGEGDCDSDADCVSGHICLREAGLAFGYSVPDLDVCAALCPTRGVGAGNYCTEACPCEEGEGDCDSDSDCESGLRCLQNVGAAYGYDDPELDVCSGLCPQGSPGGSNYCSAQCPCEEGEGDCDSNGECASGLRGLQDVGQAYGYGDQELDVCTALCPEGTAGGTNYCSAACPCDVTEGDCDSNGECVAGLVCTRDVGFEYGLGAGVDVCESLEPLTRPATGTIAAGQLHTCVLLDTGALRCWGYGGNGELGTGVPIVIGDNELPSSVGDVSVGGRVVQVATGNAHTCALLDTGAVRCWGYNRYGQLGYGHTNKIGDNELPSSVGEVDVGGRAIQLVAGASFTCALLENGAVRCWGTNAYGQLGYGHTSMIGDDEMPSSAGDVDVGGRVVHLAAGVSHVCALLDTGAVRCWGDNGSRQLGYGHINNIGDDETPASAGDVNMGGGPVVQLVAGLRHTCALIENGTVRCWGSNEFGQSGRGQPLPDTYDGTPASIGGVNVGGRAIMLAAGWSHTCALLETGAVRCWGSSSYGVLGYGYLRNIGDDERPALAGDVDVGGSAVAITAGALHTCARLDTDAMRCWGGNMWGQLGYGHTQTIGATDTPSSAGDVPYL